MWFCSDKYGNRFEKSIQYIGIRMCANVMHVGPPVLRMIGYVVVESSHFFGVK